MAKMFYTSDEASQKLGVSGDGLKERVTQNRLREFRDGGRILFKVDQVDKIVTDRHDAAAKAAGSTGLSDSGIALASDSAAGDAISLSDTRAPAAKEDTHVVPSAGSEPGVKVFESGELHPADASAQTQIQSSEDQIPLEGVGSGSGLLDLTRESDDTSLGAELLDEIYPGGDAKGETGIASASGIFEQTAASDASSASGLDHMTAAHAAPAAVTEYVEKRDASAEAFGGMAFASVLMMILAGVVGISYMQGYSPQWLDSASQTPTTLLIFTVVLVLICVFLAGIGYFIGKASR